VLAPRCRDFENAAGVPIIRLRRNETEMPYEGYSPNLIEPGFSVCRVDSHLSINISCPLLMDNGIHRTT
jgi:hypothetical protein